MLLRRETAKQLASTKSTLFVKDGFIFAKDGDILLKVYVAEPRNGFVLHSDVAKELKTSKRSDTTIDVEVYPSYTENRLWEEFEKETHPKFLDCFCKGRHYAFNADPKRLSTAIDLAREHGNKKPMFIGINSANSSQIMIVHGSHTVLLQEMES